jgi:hypothetical protein
METIKASESILNNISNLNISLKDIETQKEKEIRLIGYKYDRKKLKLIDRSTKDTLGTLKCVRDRFLNRYEGKRLSAYSNSSNCGSIRGFAASSRLRRSMLSDMFIMDDLKICREADFMGKPRYNLDDVSGRHLVIEATLPSNYPKLQRVIDGRLHLLPMGNAMYKTEFSDSDRNLKVYLVLSCSGEVLFCLPLGTEVKGRRFGEVISGVAAIAYPGYLQQGYNEGPSLYRDLFWIDGDPVPEPLIDILFPGIPKYLDDETVEEYLPPFLKPNPIYHSLSHHSDAVDQRVRNYLHVLKRVRRDTNSYFERVEKEYNDKK